jgi:cell division protein ZapA (FtsZ GTPase activity inhibitor)
LQIQGQRKETNELREENESLKAERLALMAAIEDSRCLTCSGRMVQAGETARQQLLLENTRLREEIQKTNAFLQTVSMGTTPRLTATGILFKAFQAAHMRS